MTFHAKEIIKTISTHTEKEIQLKILFPPSSLYFQGHFPETPILPGIVQLNLAIDCACNYLGIQKIQIQSIPQIKFLNPIHPNRQLRLSITVEDNVLKFSYADDQKTFSHGRILLGDLTE